MKEIIVRQYQDIIDNMANGLSKLNTPKEGWIRTARKALGMSGAQLARRLNISRQHVAQNERNELSRAITLRTLDEMAAAMNCRVVYAIVPDKPMGQIMSDRAREKAERVVQQTAMHMALEEQSVSSASLKFQLEQLELEMLKNHPSNLWND
jgi:predicted DNA-binding mobile mystery protein A